MDPVRHSLDEISKDDTLGARVGGDVDVEPRFIGHAKHLQDQEEEEEEEGEKEEDETVAQEVAEEEERGVTPFGSITTLIYKAQ